MGSNLKTKKLSDTPVVLAVALPADVVRASARAAIDAAGARLQTSDLENVATNAARYRPFAILIAQDVYEFDAAEFDDLARDVDATLLTVPTENFSMEVFQKEISPALSEAHSNRKGT